MPLFLQPLRNRFKHFTTSPQGGGKTSNNSAQAICFWVPFYIDLILRYKERKKRSYISMMIFFFRKKKIKSLTLANSTPTDSGKGDFLFSRNLTYVLYFTDFPPSRCLSALSKSSALYIPHLNPNSRVNAYQYPCNHPPLLPSPRRWWILIIYPEPKKHTWSRCKYPITFPSPLDSRSGDGLGRDRTGRGAGSERRRGGNLKPYHVH